MNSKLLRNELEKYFYIGFDIKEEDNKVFISPRGSNKENFQIVLENRNNIRLTLIVEPQKYGANFLKVLYKSSKQKRINCCAIKGNSHIYVDTKEVNDKQFIEKEDKWNSFKIIDEILPFNPNDEKAIFEKTKNLISMVLSLVDYSIEGYEEGKTLKQSGIKYERNPINRQICLNAKGYKCVICGFDFEEKYGSVGKETIEVHHTTPVSKMGDNYVVDPVKELEPVCSNCHTIIHKRETPYTIEEVKKMIEESK